MHRSTSIHPAVNDYFKALTHCALADVLGLFADDAVVLPSPMPVSGPVKGKSALAVLYEAWIKVPMKFVDLRMYDTDTGSAVEIRVEVGAEGRLLEVVDVFDLDARGRIVRMAAYKR